MSDFMKDIINQSTLDECNDILSHAESIVGTNIINNVNELTKELDCLIDQMHKKVLKEEYQISDKELEKLIIRLPILIYELNNVLMKAGIREDLSKIIKQINYNQAFSIQEGTIADKKSGAELAVKEEQLLETTWKRSVKIISQKMDIANDLLSSCKKIFSKRIEEVNLIKRSPEY
ncbi:MAG: hypothetical protein SPJ27_00885 [Candidatus Onthovivens sp.]|nr:hypothetical protein [Candidatus Onthovivens sp.]